jgi:hypothetical protein
MNKIVLASAIALVCGAPMAFAAGNGIGNAAPTTDHCSYLDTQYNSQAATEKAMSACRQDPHKNDVSKLGSKSGETRDHAVRG